MIIKKTPQEIEGIRKAGSIVAQAIFEMAQFIRPGVTTREIEAVAKGVFERYGAQSAFFGYRPGYGMPPYPGYVCISVNDEIVHGIPGDRVIRDGDLVSLDVGVKYRGFIGDAAATILVGNVSDKARRLARVTYEALHKGIDAAVPGNRISDISRAVQNWVERHGYSVVRDLVGHGVGIYLHEDPQVPNFVSREFPDPVLEEGMTIAIEPMVCEKSYRTRVDSDGWTVRTADGGLSAHFEHSIAITKDGPVILTLLENGEEPYVPK